MELKVGEIFEFEGVTLQAIETEDMTCIKCYFNYLKNCDFHCEHFKIYKYLFQ